MKRIIFLCLFLHIGNLYSFGQSSSKKVQSATIKVNGVCEECRERIENAAYIKGVKRADWNKNSKELTLFFKPSKVSLPDIQKHIAEAGHDAGGIKASDSAYHLLPDCCAYKEQTTH